MIHAENHSTVGEGVRVTFQPTTYNTGCSIRCADPNVWVLVRQGNGTSLGRSGDRREEVPMPSTTGSPLARDGWIWIFPSDAPLGQEIEDGSGTHDLDTIVTTPERLAKVVNQRPSEWTIGVYDKPAQQSPMTTNQS
ncbi:hypothetical protein ACIBG4_04645 [Nonomuraea sp. NPDC050383]|uniref:hypothetical protein n=1 Tax=Nonomuraea sp. NPDC050383 TaxID=3364362 RepID=UPI00379632EF